MTEPLTAIDPPKVPLRSLDSELLALIAANAVRSRNLTLLGASIPFGVLLTTKVWWGWVFGWWMLLAAAVITRTWLVLRWQEDGARESASKLRMLAGLYAVMACLQSLVMAFFPHVPVSVGAMLTMYLVGMVSGMVPSVAGARSLTVPYTLIVMPAIALTWAVAPLEDFGVVARILFVGMSLMYVPTLLAYGDTAYTVFSESFRIRLQHFELNQRLQTALDRAEAASRAKTRFLASASHDLRQPIHALSLFSGSLLLRDLDTRSHTIAVQLDKSVRVMTSQLDALLDISRLDAGVVEQSIANMDLSGLLEQLVEEYEPQTDKKGVALEFGRDAMLHVRSDPALLRRVLSNLISNAVKYTHSGAISISTEMEAESCRVIISDTGPGIPLEEKERVFEEFYQLENPERDRTKGLGLGLSIARRLCGLLNIALQMESTVGKGTTFTLTIPMAVRLDESRGSESFPQNREPGIRVLVIEDEEDVRLGMQTLLEEMSFDVRVASTTPEALGVVRGFRPAIVLADFRLRGREDGIDAVRQLRRVQPELPAILISGDTAPDRLREARDAGLELLHKPVTAADLRDAIIRVASK